MQFLPEKVQPKQSICQISITISPPIIPKIPEKCPPPNLCHSSNNGKTNLKYIMQKDSYHSCNEKMTLSMEIPALQWRLPRLPIIF